MTLIKHRSRKVVILKESQGMCTYTFCMFLCLVFAYVRLVIRKIIFSLESIITLTEIKCVILGKKESKEHGLTDSSNKLFKCLLSSMAGEEVLCT